MSERRRPSLSDQSRPIPRGDPYDGADLLPRTASSSASKAPHDVLDQHVGETTATSSTASSQQRGHQDGDHPVSDGGVDREPPPFLPSIAAPIAAMASPVASRDLDHGTSTLTPVVDERDQDPLADPAHLIARVPSIGDDRKTDIHSVETGRGPLHDLEPRSRSSPTISHSPRDPVTASGVVPQGQPEVAAETDEMSQDPSKRRPTTAQDPTHSSAAATDEW